MGVLVKQVQNSWNSFAIAGSRQPQTPFTGNGHHLLFFNPGFLLQALGALIKDGIWRIIWYAKFTSSAQNRPSAAYSARRNRLWKDIKDIKRKISQQNRKQMLQKRKQCCRILLILWIHELIFLFYHSMHSQCWHLFLTWQSEAECITFCGAGAM